MEFKTKFNLHNKVYVVLHKYKNNPFYVPKQPFTVRQIIFRTGMPINDPIYEIYRCVSDNEIIEMEMTEEYMFRTYKKARQSIEKNSLVRDEG